MPIHARAIVAMLLFCSGCPSKPQHDAPFKTLNPNEKSFSKASEPAPTATSQAFVISRQDRDHAGQIWAQRCVLCHGPLGEGNGIAAANLKPRPRNLQDANWQQSTDDDAIAKIIVQGGPSIGKSMMMPSNPDLADKKNIVQALIEHIRSLKKQG